MTVRITAAQITAARWARISAVAGVVAAAALGAFFGLGRPFSATPDPGAMWLGPVNDAASVVQYAALIPVARALRRCFAADPGAGRPVLVVTDVATAAMAVYAGLQVLLLAGAVPFAVQAPFVTAAGLVCLGWTVFTSRVGARTGLLPRRVVLAGTAAGLLVPTALLIGGSALLVPAASTARPVLLWLALGVGVVGWSAIVPWTYFLADGAALTPMDTSGRDSRSGRGPRRWSAKPLSRPNPS